MTPFVMARFLSLNLKDCVDSGTTCQAVATWMRTITAYEELLLETLCFDLTVEHPHHFLLIGAEALDAADTTLGWAWSIVNDM